MVRRDIKFARSLSIATKLKFPFPHMVAVVMKERSGGGLQLLTQGTADIILDSCIEYWDGHDLCPLSASDRYIVQFWFYWSLKRTILDYPIIQDFLNMFLECKVQLLRNDFDDFLFFIIAEKRYKTSIRGRAWPHIALLSLIDRWRAPLATRWPKYIWNCRRTANTCTHPTGVRPPCRGISEKY